MVEGANYSSSRDRRPVEGVNNYYGKLTDIIELNYSGMIRVVLFKCEWVDINRGCKKDGNVTLVNFSYKTHTGVNLIDDPFGLASQADKSMCDLRRKSRAKMEEPHVSGTKSFARLAHEEALKNGVYPTRGQIYVKTRTRKNGNIVNEKVAQVMTSLQAIASDSSNTQGSNTLGFVDDFSNDDYSKVKGPEKRGYIRCVGRMPTVKEKVVSCSNDPSVEQLKTMVNVMANIIQEHIPNANLSGILNNMNIQMPGNTSTGPRNSNLVNQRASSESHHNDGNHFYELLYFLCSYKYSLFVLSVILFIL
uniref:DUF4216 domain-containing protein n=1 Tax=Lactuca sativa TaxID=4236 RepID=A0A9R1WHF0_LACSA|nr:hypothetical protein LSAT_V11C200094810 [Lactuca sativa]